MGYWERKVTGVLVILVLAMVGTAIANELKIPNDNGSSGPRVTCDVAGWDYQNRTENAQFDDTGGFLDFGPLHVGSSGTIADVVLELNIEQTWIGDLIVYLSYDEDGNGSVDHGPVMALCRPALDGCAFDGCCGCSGNINGLYTFGDDAADPLGEFDCPTDVPPGCFTVAVESPMGFADTFGGAATGGNFWLEVADGAGGDATSLYAWGVYVRAEGEPELTVLHDGSGDVPTIQEAIDLIAPGGTVYLGDGTFFGPGNFNLDFNGKDFTLRSLSLNPEVCFIDGGNDARGSGSVSAIRTSSLGSNQDRDRPSANGINFTSGEGPAAEVRGITFIYGSATFGGGIYIDHSSPTISDCNFQSNLATEGGGIYAQFSSTTIQRCTFYQNYGAWSGAIGVSGTGSNVTISDCMFNDNIASELGGAIDVHNMANASVTFCTFIMNEAHWGGAVAIEYPASLDIRYSTLTENTADWGGGIYSEDTHRCWFNIISFSNGGGAYAYNPVLAGARDTFDFACCNFFGNVEGDWTGGVAGQLGINGNFSADPEYCGMIGTGNLYLQSDSPCLALNNDCAQQIGAWPQGCGNSASRPSSWSEVKSMY